MSKRTLFLIFALFIITFVLLAITLYDPYSRKLQSQERTSPTAPIAQTILSFGQPVATPSSTASLNYTLPINITTGNNKVTAVQLEMQYDPKILTNVSVTPGSFFKNPVVLLNQIDAKTGRISYAFGISPAEQGVVGNAVAAILIFKTSTTAPEQTAILFLPKTLVTAEGITQSVLKSATPINITVEQSIVTPSPVTSSSNTQ